MNEIKIKVDFENKEIHGLECDYENKLEIAKVLINVGAGMLNKIIVSDKYKRTISWLHNPNRIMCFIFLLKYLLIMELKKYIFFL